MFQIIMSGFMIMSLVSATAFAQGSLAEKIAENKKLELIKTDAQVQNALESMEKSLLLVKAEVERADLWDYNHYYDWATRASLVVSAVALGLAASYKGRTDHFAFGLALMIGSVGGLAVAEVITLIDLLLYPADVDSEKFNQQVAVAVGALVEFRKTQVGEKRDQVTEVISLVESMANTVSEEEKKEVARETVQKFAILLGIGAVGTSMGIRSRHAGAFTATTLSLGVLAGGAAGWASFKSSDNKEAVLRAVDEALKSVREAQALM